MRILLKASVVVAVSFAIMIVMLSSKPISRQTPAVYKAPRTFDGKPNLSGIWQAANTANWELPNTQTFVSNAGDRCAIGA
jgi:hypothetical protein